MTFTAKATLFASGYGNSPSVALSRDYAVKVAPKSAEDIAAEKAELEAALAKIDGLVKDYADSSKTVDLSDVEGDFCLLVRVRLVPARRSSRILPPATTP